MTTRAYAVLKWRRKKVEVCLFSEFISWWNNALMQSDYRWLAQPSGKIIQKNLPWYLPWRSLVIEDGFGLYRTVVFHPWTVLSTHWPPPRSYAAGGFELGECSFSENSENIGKFLHSSAHPPQRERRNCLDFIRLCWISAWILVKNEQNISGQISFIKATLQLRLTLYMMMKH